MSRTFTATGSLSMARFKLPYALALLQNGKALVAGGAERAEVYDPTAGTFSAAGGSLGTARFFSAATLLPDGRVLITGGYYEAPGGGLPSTASAWIYQP